MEGFGDFCYLGRDAGALILSTTSHSLICSPIDTLTDTLTCTPHCSAPCDRPEWTPERDAARARAPVPTSRVQRWPVRQQARGLAPRQQGTYLPVGLVSSAWWWVNRWMMTGFPCFPSVSTMTVMISRRR